jgi:hypothetical protein
MVTPWPDGSLSLSLVDQLCPACSAAAGGGDSTPRMIAFQARLEF